MVKYRHCCNGYDYGDVKHSLVCCSFVREDTRQFNIKRLFKSFPKGETFRAMEFQVPCTIRRKGFTLKTHEMFSAPNTLSAIKVNVLLFTCVPC